MAVFSDYMDLRKGIMDIVQTPSIVESLDRYVVGAEAWISRTLRHRKQEATATVTFTDGRATLPTDYREMLHIFDANGCELMQGPLSSVQQSGTQYRWYAVDDGEIVIYGKTGDQVITYYSAIPTITGALTDSNWVLADYPDLYLFGSAYEAAKGVGLVDLVEQLLSGRNMALQEAKIDSDRAKYGRADIRLGGVIV